MQIVIGALVHCLNSTTIQYSPQSVVGVSKQGSIDFLVHLQHDGREVDTVLEEIFTNEEYKKKGWNKDVKKTILSHGEFLCPGFIDTHTHGS
jgi:N-acetylglucosamine-6-phosphate deacetylase